MPTDLIDYTEGDSTQIYKTEIEIEYVHQLKELYKRVHTWFEEENYQDSSGQDVFEELYWQRDLPDGLAEHQMWWRAWKHPGKTSEEHKFFTHLIKLDFQTIAVSKAEVMHKGKKWNMFKSNTIIRIEAYQILNADVFRGGILKSIRNRFKGWMYKDRIEHFEIELYNKTVELINEIKRFVELRQEIETPPGVHPPNTLP